MLSNLIVNYTHLEITNIYCISSTKQKKLSSNRTNTFTHRYCNTKH